MAGILHTTRLAYSTDIVNNKSNKLEYHTQEVFTHFSKPKYRIKNYIVFSFLICSALADPLAFHRKITLN